MPIDEIPCSFGRYRVLHSRDLKFQMICNNDPQNWHVCDDEGNFYTRWNTYDIAVYFAKTWDRNERAELDRQMDDLLNGNT